MVMPGRNYTFTGSSSLNRYRFGFNGIEKTNELKGAGNHYTALHGEYDPRIVYRWNTDPKPVEWESPYAMFRNSPVWYSDPLLDYSKIGAKIRNTINGGSGIKYNEATKEWGYSGGNDAGDYRDGLSDKKRLSRIEKYRETHSYVEGVGWTKRNNATISQLPYGRNGVRNRMTDFSKTNHALTIGGGVLGALEGLSVSQGYWLGKNGKYYEGFSGRGPNQFTGSRAGALKAANSYKLAGIAAVVVEAGIGVYSTIEGYELDGNKFGYNAQHAAASTVGSIALAKGGAAAGAAVGVWFGGVGAIPGAVIGGVIGGFGFGIGGSYLGGAIGGSAVDYLHDR